MTKPELRQEIERLRKALSDIAQHRPAFVQPTNELLHEQIHCLDCRALSTILGMCPRHYGQFAAVEYTNRQTVKMEPASLRSMAARALQPPTQEELATKKNMERP